MSINDIETGYGICGLVCSLCSYNENCSGCRGKDSDCEVKNCCIHKKYRYCFECLDWPCEKNMHSGIRIKAFNQVAKDEGLQKLAGYLYKNKSRGITYHKANGLKGDYDLCKTQEEVINLLKNGKPNPYDICPVYESKRFILRLVSIEEAQDLLECYNNPHSKQLFNTDNCTFGYTDVDTKEKMEQIIILWLKEYHKKHFVRFSIIDKQDNKAVGTIEIFNGGYHNHSVLRIDIAPKHENFDALQQLIEISHLFFYDFGCEKIVTKAITIAKERIDALIENGYEIYAKNENWNRDDYFIRNKDC